MTDAFKCTHCDHVKPGRFRRPQESPFRSGHGWDRGSQQVTWVCHDCDQKQGTAPVDDAGTWYRKQRKD